MNKPVPQSYHNFLAYSELFSPYQPFSKYILYSPKLYIELQRNNIGFYDDIGRQILSDCKPMLGKEGKFDPFNKDLQVFIDFDTKIFALMIKNLEVLRLNFEYYVMENDFI